MGWTKYALILIAILVTGCATTRQVDNQVQTLSTLKSLPVAGYRFERLPSQQTPEQAPNQSAIEAMAERAMAMVGLQRNDAKPGYSLQVSASVQRDAYSGWVGPWYGRSHLSIGFGTGRGGRGGVSTGLFTGFPAYTSPLVRREVSLVLRDLSTAQVVYETRALHESAWLDDNNILPVMFQAAVSGFPTPPAERRTVHIALPPASAPPPPASSSPEPQPVSPTSP